MIKKIWSCDKCDTIKSCAGVILIGATVAAFLLIIRLVGEKRLQRFLNYKLFFKRREREVDLAAESFVQENQI